MKRTASLAFHLKHPHTKTIVSELLDRFDVQTSYSLDLFKMKIKFSPNVLLSFDSLSASRTRLAPRSALCGPRMVGRMGGGRPWPWPLVSATVATMYCSLRAISSLMSV